MSLLVEPSALPEAAPPAVPPIDPVVVNAVLIAVRQAADLLCDRWTLQVLLAAHAGVTRFADFRERCGGVATRLLGSRLQMLEEQEVLVRLAYMRRPLRHGYHLTHMGLALFDVLAAMLRWEQDWHPAADGVGARLTHTACGCTDVRPTLPCAACGEAVSARAVALGISQKEVRTIPPKAVAYRRSAQRAAQDAAAPRVPLPHVLEIFGDKWTIEVVMCAFVRVTTFGGFQAHAGMSTNILADRLARLTALGILRPVDGTEGPRRGSYRLTDRGVALFPILVQIEAWADQWQRDRFRSPMRLTHRPCGQPLKIATGCHHCGQPLTRADSVLQTAA